MRTTAAASGLTGQVLSRLDENPSEQARYEFRCLVCGYGAVAAAPPLRRPMCGQVRWTPPEGPRATDSEPQP